MSRYRVTVRGDGAELRGYVTIPTLEGLGEFAKLMTPVGVVMASEADHDYNPFGITDPDNPPTLDGSLSAVMRVTQQVPEGESVLAALAHLHYMQATVIRQERYQREQAEAELTKRELHHCETEQINERLEAELRELRG